MQNRTLHKTKQHTLTTLNNRATHKTTKHYYEPLDTLKAYNYSNQELHYPLINITQTKKRKNNILKQLHKNPMTIKNLI